MAKVTIVNKDVEVIKKIKQKRVILELSVEEAELLCTLTGSIISTGKSRHLMNDIFNILCEKVDYNKWYGKIENIIIKD